MIFSPVNSSKYIVGRSLVSLTNHLGSLPVSKFTNTRLCGSSTEPQRQTVVQSAGSLTAQLVFTASLKVQFRTALAKLFLYVTDLQSCLLQTADVINFKSTKAKGVKYLCSIFTYQTLIFPTIVFYQCWHHLDFLVLFKPR